MQCVNDISESVANGDVFADRQASLSVSSVPVRTRPEGQENAEDASRTVQRYIEIRSKRCSEVYKVKKIYVGLLRELPPPTAVQEKWDREVWPDLERHLCQATSMLSKSLRDEEVITEAVLCMAGKKCSPALVLLPPGATCPKYPIALKPTVWIHCGSKKCKKRVLGTIRNLAYLNHFLDKFCMEPPYVSLHAPWPAAGNRPLDAPRGEGKVHKISFAVQRPASGWTTICGVKARFTIQTPDGILERYSTLGGMIIVENSLFGLTSAHPVVNYCLENSNGAPTDEVELMDNCSSDSGSDYETSSDSGSETSTRSLCSSPARTTYTDRPAAEAYHVHKRGEDTWVELPLPKVVAYLGHGTISGDYSFRSPAPNTSDFTLIDLGTLPMFPNGFNDPVHQSVTNIWDFILTSDLVHGEVWIIATSCDEPIKGYLLEGNASVILRGTIIRTKKIQVAFPGVPGLSGSWVVREGKLCGSIYAAYDRSPYLHMLPAESIFQDVAKFLGASNIRVATPLDIRQRWSLAAQLTEQFRKILSKKRLNHLRLQTATHKYGSQASREFDAANAQTQSTPPRPFAPLRNLPLVPQPPQDAKSLRFKNMLQSLSDMPVRWEKLSLLDEALRVVPLEKLYNEAEEESQMLQAEAESLGAKKARWGYQDCVVKALMRWFKRSFFTWVNNPPCGRCYSPTIGVGMSAPLPDEQARGAKQVELYKCSAEQCGHFERFPRYNDAFVLLQTRRGRNGEWANCFGMLCRAVGSRVRWVWSAEDYPWTEIYSVYRKRWIHVDCCEEAWDKPRLYTEGWGLKLSYCIAFSTDGAKDVTRRYVRNPLKYGLERNRAPEAVVLHIMDEIRSMRRSNMSKQEKFRLEGEDIREDQELHGYVIASIAHEVSEISAENILNGRVTSKAGPDDQKALEGRTSGNAQWIRARGEDGRGTLNQQDPSNQRPR